MSASYTFRSSAADVTTTFARPSAELASALASLSSRSRSVILFSAVQETNKGLQAVAAEVKEARRGLVPVGDLTAGRSALSAAKKRVADLERELKEARAEASSAEGRGRK